MVITGEAHRSLLQGSKLSTGHKLCSTAQGRLVAACCCYTHERSRQHSCACPVLKYGSQREILMPDGHQNSSIYNYCGFVVWQNCLVSFHKQTLVKIPQYLGSPCHQCQCLEAAVFWKGAEATCCICSVYRIHLSTLLTRVGPPQDVVKKRLPKG